MVAKKSSSARIFCNLVSRFGLILTNILFSIEWKYFQGASPIIGRVMVIFSSQPLKKWFCFGFFGQSDSPGNSQNVKMRNFCNGF